jgi:hypothetical protein
MSTDDIKTQLEGIQHDHIRKQIDDIHDHGYTLLKGLAIVLLLIQVAFFVDLWYGGPSLQREIGSLGASLVFIPVVLYFWSLLGKPHFCVLFIELPDEERRPIDKQRFLAELFERQEKKRKKNGVSEHKTLPLLFIPVCISLGLALSGLVAWLEWYPFNVGKTPFGPLVVILSLIMIFFLLYRTNADRLQRALPWLLSIPAGISILVVLLQIYYSTLNWYGQVLAGTAPPVGSTDFITNIAFFGSRTAFLVSFVMFLYLVYRSTTEYRGVYVETVGKHLQGLIDNGVAVLPKRVRVGDSHSILLDLKLSESIVKRASGTDGSCESSDYLEANLQAAGLNVDGESRQRICEDSPLPTTIWNCSFPSSGIQTINLLIDEVKSVRNRRHVVFAQKHEIKVDNFLGVSWKPVLALVTPFLAAVVSAVVQVLLLK